MVSDSLLDLPEDTLLLIVDHILLNKSALLALQNSCWFFKIFFTTYSIWQKHETALENAWMIQLPVDPAEVVIASTVTEKEAELNNSEHMEVLFMDVCDKYIVLVRYNQLDITCSCPTMACQCEEEDLDSSQQNLNAMPKRLEIWDSNFQIVRVISSKNFGLNTSQTLGGTEQFKFWSSMKREYPLFSYNKQRKIFAWVGTMIKDIQVDFHFIEENQSSCIKIGNNRECSRAYAVSMLGGRFAIAFEQKFSTSQFQLLIRWYEYDCLENFIEMQICESQGSLGKYSFNNCSPMDISQDFTVIVTENQEREGEFKMSSVDSKDLVAIKNLQLNRNISNRIFMKMNEKTSLVALLYSSEQFGEHSVVKLFRGQDLEEIKSVDLRNHCIDKTALTESSNRVFWYRDILVVVSDEDIDDEPDFMSGRRLTFFKINDQQKTVVQRQKEVDFWPGFVSKQTSSDPKLPLLGPGKDKGLFLEAAAVGELGVVIAARLHSNFNEDLDELDEMSFLFYISMLPF